MIEKYLTLALSNFTITTFILGLLFAFIAIIMKPKSINHAFVIEKILAFFILFNIAVGYLYNFVVHVFYGDYVAHFIGWAQSPFQAEVGFASLGFALVGFYAWRRSFEARFCAILGPAMFLWGAACGHIYQIISQHNLAPGNAGSILYTDILLPAIGFILLIWWHKANHPKGNMNVKPAES
jgi:hypothetical protein